MQNEYSLEELLPLVAELTEKYTSKESTSISYDTANQLMNAVRYNITACYIEEDRSVAIKNLSARDAYEFGKKKIKTLCEKTLEKYNQLLISFDSYGNKNYGDTVTKAIAYFFQRYNVQYNPQGNVITFDYAVLGGIGDATGIIAMSRYIDAISVEQRFLNKFDKNFVKTSLKEYCKNYEEQFDNIANIVMRKIMIHMILKTDVTRQIEEKDYEPFSLLIKQKRKYELESFLENVLKQLVDNMFFGDDEMYLYFREDIKDFSALLHNFAMDDKIIRVFEPLV